MYLSCNGDTIFALHFVRIISAESVKLHFWDKPRYVMLSRISSFFRSFFRKFLLMFLHVYLVKCCFCILGCNHITQRMYEIVWTAHLKTNGLSVASPDDLIYFLLISFSVVPWKAMCTTRQYILKWIGSTDIPDPTKLLLLLE